VVVCGEVIGRGMIDDSMVGISEVKEEGERSGQNNFNKK
jgi:hypothetical protein